jgi:hypothetical protein
MAEETIRDLMRQAPFSFVGTVEQLGAATMAELPIDERTAVVRIERVLRAPGVFANMDGQRVTIQLASDAELPSIGETAAFFVQGFVFGKSVAVKEIGRVPVQDVEPYLARAAERGERGAFEPIQRQLEAARLREHADGSDAVVLGRVVKLEDVPGPVRSEHDPDWWKATLDVYHVEKGDVQLGELEVLFPNSLDVRWHDAPKPKPSEVGMFILHATEGELRQVVPFQILHPEDYQPVQQLDAVRGTGV